MHDKYWTIQAPHHLAGHKKSLYRHGRGMYRLSGNLYSACYKFSL